MCPWLCGKKGEPDVFYCENERAKSAGGTQGADPPSSTRSEDR